MWINRMYPFYFYGANWFGNNCNFYFNQARISENVYDLSDVDLASPVIEATVDAETYFIQLVSKASNGTMRIRYSRTKREDKYSS